MPKLSRGSRVGGDRENFRNDDALVRHTVTNFSTHQRVSEKAIESTDACACMHAWRRVMEQSHQSPDERRAGGARSHEYHSMYPLSTCTHTYCRHASMFPWRNLNESAPFAAGRGNTRLFQHILAMALWRVQRCHPPPIRRLRPGCRPCMLKLNRGEEREEERTRARRVRDESGGMHATDH